MIQLKHADENKGVLIVDVVSPVAVRRLEVYKEKQYLAWNGTPESLSEYSYQLGKLEKANLSENTEHLEGYNAFIIENAYKNEMQAFFRVIQTGEKPVYGYEKDLKILRMIDAMGVD